MSLLRKLSEQDDLNFYLTNYLPRRGLTRLVGRLSRIKVPWFRDLCIWCWQLFSDDLDLNEAKKTRFDSLHDCFVRELKPGARPINNTPGIIVSPCDGIVGAHGEITDDRLLQAKGSFYRLSDLLDSREMAVDYLGGRFVTLRLKSNMYHRFHAPSDCYIDGLRYISGDTWNVNPVTLQRVQGVFCKNERAVIPLKLPEPEYRLTLVPVAAILVASIQIHCLPKPLDLSYRGPHDLVCDQHYTQGEELGYFQHGSTIIVLASKHFEFADNLLEYQLIRMGQRLFRST